MNILETQKALNQLGYATEDTGLPNPAFWRTVDEALDAYPDADNWTDARKLIAIEQRLYASLGIEVGAIDGLVGPQTQYARSVYVARKAGKDDAETWRDKLSEGPPGGSVAATKWPRQKDVEKFFGKPADKNNLVYMKFAYPMRLAWDLDTIVARTMCHKLVKEPMERIFERTLGHYTLPEIKRLRLDRFGGCYNPRRMRGGTSWSMHAWGIAIDIDPERNPLRATRATATLDGREYDDFWKFVYDEGAISLGRERDFDWMHFQFARL